MTFTIVQTTDSQALHESRVTRWLNDGWEIVATGQYYIREHNEVTYWTHMVKR